MTIGIVLAGCSSNSPFLKDIFLLSTSYANPPITPLPLPLPSSSNTTYFKDSVTASKSNLVIRTGYYGLCISTSNSNGDFTCNSNIASLTAGLPSTSDPLNLIGQSQSFKDKVVFPYLIVIGLVAALFVIALLATFPGWHEETNDNGSEVEVKPFPSHPVVNVAYYTSQAATFLIFASAVWQHASAVAFSIALQNASAGLVKSEVGTSAMVLVWFGFGLLALVTIGLYILILSIKLLKDITDDDDDDDGRPGTAVSRRETLRSRTRARSPRPHDDGDE